MKHFTSFFCVLICSTTLLVAQEVDELQQETTAPNSVVEPEVSGKVEDVSVRIRPADHSLLPNVREIGEVRVDLMEKDSSLYAASDAPEGSVAKNLQVKQLRGYQLSASATDAVQQAVVARVNEMGIGSVAVLFTTPESGEVGRATINVVAGTLAEVNVKSMDDAVGEPASAPLVSKLSPIQVDGTEPALLEVDELNQYLAQLNRFPGRSVTAAISAGENPGTLMLDYLIDEKVPLPSKDKTLVFQSGNSLLWLVGMRPDERFKISKETKNVLDIRVVR